MFGGIWFQKRPQLTIYGSNSPFKNVGVDCFPFFEIVRRIREEESLSVTFKLSKKNKNKKTSVFLLTVSI